MKFSAAIVNVMALSCAIGCVDAQLPPTRQDCKSDDDCVGDTLGMFGKYCSTVDNTCVAAGDCTAVEDCTDNLSNVFAVPMCLGTIYCIEDAGLPGKCVNICDGTPSTCDAFEACDDAGLAGECCPNADGKFLACCAGVTLAPTTVPESRPEDAFCSMYPACIDAGLTADVGGEAVCCPDDEGDFLDCCDGGKVDESVPVIMPSDPNDPVEGDTPVVMPSDPNDPVEGDTPVVMPSDPNDPVEGDIPVIMPSDPNDPIEGDTPVVMPSDPNDVVEGDTPVIMPSDPNDAVEGDCTSDSDCDSDTEYCGQGTCLPNGMCTSDTDCVNPANLLLNDKRCVGYLYCNTTINICDRMCGEQCPGDLLTTECSVTGCDTKNACPGAVNCSPDLCDEDCKGIYYDGAGTVLTECHEDQEGEGVSMVGEPLSQTIAPTEAEVTMVGEPEVRTMAPTGADGIIDPEFGVDAPQSCVDDTDCDSDTEYCGQGTCVPNGMCISDTDCVNPSNVLLKDKKCVGYLYCDTSVNTCDRMCGEQCPGDLLTTECSITGCDTRIACPGAVNCSPDLCDEDCKGIYFDSSGHVLKECHEDQEEGQTTTTAATADEDASVGALSSGNSLSAPVMFIILMVAVTGLVVGTI